MKNEISLFSSSLRHVMLQYFGIFQPSSGIMMTENKIYIIIRKMDFMLSASGGAGHHLNISLTSACPCTARHLHYSPLGSLWSCWLACHLDQNCQALIPIPVALDPNPKQSKIQSLMGHPPTYRVVTDKWYNVWINCDFNLSPGDLFSLWRAPQVWSIW